MSVVQTVATRQHFKTLKAFTLIELLVVMGILSLLISILLPSLAGARQVAQRNSCLANLRRVATSSVLYLERSEGRFAPFRLKTVNGATYVNAYNRTKPRWQWFFGLDIGPVIQPPTNAAGPWGDSVTREMTNAFFICPSLIGPFSRDIRNGAYGYNYQYLGNSRRDADSASYDNFAVSENEIAAPSVTVLVADSRGASPEHGKHAYTLDPPRLATEKNAQRFGPGSSDGPIQHSPAEARHRGRAIVSFVDGHAEAMTLEQLGYDVGSNGVVIPHTDNPGLLATNRLWSGTGKDDFTAR